MTQETFDSSVRDDWDRHWDEYGLAAQANPAQEYRRRIILSFLHLQDLGDGVRILDVGSGQGDMAAAVRRCYPRAKIVGLELSESGVEISRRKVPGARFLQCNLLAEADPPEDLARWATHAICSEVIEHVDDPLTLLRRARAYMRPGCKLVVSAPGGPMSAFDRHIGHRQHFRPSGLTSLLREAGYIPGRVTGAGFPFFNFYRCGVVLRGEKLIEDVSVRRKGTPSFFTRLAMTLFDKLFWFNLTSSPWGWQMLGEGHVPDAIIL